MNILWWFEWGCLFVLAVIVLIVLVLSLRDRKRKGQKP